MSRTNFFDTTMCIIALEDIMKHEIYIKFPHLFQDWRAFCVFPVLCVGCYGRTLNWCPIERKVRIRKGLGSFLDRTIPITSYNTRVLSKAWCSNDNDDINDIVLLSIQLYRYNKTQMHIFLISIKHFIHFVDIALISFHHPLKP